VDTRRLVVPGERAGERLDRFLAGALADLSRARIQRLIADGHVTLGGTRCGKPSLRLRGGEELLVSVPPSPPVECVPEEAPLDVLYEDQDLAVVNKPAGMVVHPAPGHERGTLVNVLLGRVGGLSALGGPVRPGIVHRLDKDTSGILVVAKTDAAHARLADQMSRHAVDRRYRGIVWGRPPAEAGTVDAPVGRHPVHRKKMAVLAAGGRRAVTRYRLLESFGGFSLLEFRLETGRTHQIRLHCAHMRCPIVGDHVYGRPRAVPLGGAGKTRRLVVSRYLLHAFRLGFVHPRTGERLVFETPDPPEFHLFRAAAALS